MKLNLKKPIVFFDLETTGTSIISDRIIEISYLKVMPNNTEEIKTQRINPGIPIPAESSAIHGIRDEDVKNSPLFKIVAKSLASEIDGCDLAGYNSNRFDIPILVEEFLRAEIEIDWTKRKFIDVQTIFHKKEPRTLHAALKFYCNRNLENAHSAEGDIKATYEVLKAQLDRYPDLQNDIIFLSNYSSFNNNVDFAGYIIYNEKEQEIFNFGKYKKRIVEDILREDPSYYNWLMQGNFPLYTKKIFINIKLRKEGNNKQISIKTN